MDWKLTRRSWLQAAGFGSLVTGATTWTRAVTGQALTPAVAHGAHGGHLAGTVGRVDPVSFDPSRFVRSWNFNALTPDAQSRFYRETTRPDGTFLREYEIYAVDREIEIAPGVTFPAWTYNGQVPGPTIRATEGDRLRIRFLNQGTHPHTMHFHGWHPPEMDGSLPEHQVCPASRSSMNSTPNPPACTCITATRFR